MSGSILQKVYPFHDSCFSAMFLTSPSDCKFDGPADEETVFKEGQNITVSRSFFDPHYLFRHEIGLI